MTDDNMGTVPGTAGAGGSPTAPASADTNLSSPVDQKAFEAALQEIKKLHGEINALKSDKDKGVAKVARQVNDISEQLKQYEKLRSKGLEPEEAERQLEINAILAERRAGSGAVIPPDATPAGNAQAANDYLAALLDPLGLKADDADILRIVNETEDPLQQVSKVAELAQRRREAQARPANPAQVMSTGGGVTTSSVTTESLRTEYEQLTKNIPPGEWGVKQRFDVKLEIRKKANEAKVPSPV